MRFVNPAAEFYFSKSFTYYFGKASSRLAE